MRWRTSHFRSGVDVVPASPYDQSLRVETPLIGQVFGHYRILDQLGAGGMGVVYRAQDQRLGRLVALKVLPPGAAHDEEAVERFRREARTASSLSHPNICTIYSFDEIDGQLVLAMELLDGETLDRRLPGRPLDLGRLLDLSEQIADALDAAHSQGILHRDIKPANIFLTRRGQAKVLDFGLAKLAPEFHGMARHAGLQPGTQASAQFSSIVGTTVGTIAYMSPEQARGEELDPRTDLFSCGVVLYEMATGRQGFPGHTTAVIFDGILNREPRLPSTVNTTIPPELDRIISKALEKDRALRYQTAADLRSDLRRLRRDSGSRRVAARRYDTDPNAATIVLAAPGLRTSTAETTAHASSAKTAPDAAPTAGATVPLAPPADVVTSKPRASARPSRSMLALAVTLVLLTAVGLTLSLSRVERTAEGAAVETLTPSPPQSVAADPTVVVRVAPSSPSSAPPVTTPATEPDGGDAAAEPAKTPSSEPPATPGEPPRAERPVTRGAMSTDSAAVDAKPRVTRGEAAAAQRMAVAKAKLASSLPDQAIGDLRLIVLDYPTSRIGADAALMVADELEKMGRIEDAIGAHVEFANRFRSDSRLPQSRLRLAALTLRSRLPNRESSARDILGNIAHDYPKTPQALVALQRKLQLETNNRQKERDPLLGIDVPIALPTLRMIAEQFPKEPATMLALNRLAQLYMDVDQHERAAHALIALATRFPANPHDAWYRLGELYERHLNDPVRARAAYAKVPSSSLKYKEAQKRANRS
jgi:serine/threonine protein kinase/TolA-binding protein